MSFTSAWQLWHWCRFYPAHKLVWKPNDGGRHPKMLGEIPEWPHHHNPTLQWPVVFFILYFLGQQDKMGRNWACLVNILAGSMFWAHLILVSFSTHTTLNLWYQLILTVLLNHILLCESWHQYLCTAVALEHMFTFSTDPHIVSWPYYYGQQSTTSWVHSYTLNVHLSHLPILAYHPTYLSPLPYHHLQHLCHTHGCTPYVVWTLLPPTISL